MNRLSIFSLAMLFFSSAFANQDLKIDSPAALPKPASQAGTQKVTINNRVFLVESNPSRNRATASSPSRFQSSVLIPGAVTKGMKVKNAATGSLATVTGRFSVLLNPATDAQTFADQFGLRIYRQMGNSRLYIFEAAEHVDILSIEKALKEANGAEAVKVELLENLMEPL